MHNMDRRAQLRAKLANREAKAAATASNPSENAAVSGNVQSANVVRNTGETKQDLRIKAEKLEAQFMHGRLCYESKHYAQAALALQKAADQGHQGAMYYLGKCLLDEETPIKYPLALHWFKKVADEGTPADMNDPINAEYRSHAEYRLAAMYFRGQGTENNIPNHSEALKYFGSAADKGNAEAQYLVASMYYVGQGTEGNIPNYSQALKYYAKAHQQNLDKATYNLAVMYRDQQGVLPKERTAKSIEAVKLFKQLADKGYGPAVTYLNSKKKDAQQETKGQKQDAIEWIETLAKQGSAKHQIDLGIIYYYGENTAQDYFKAFTWLTQAFNSTRKNPEALSAGGSLLLHLHLGTMYFMGLGIDEKKVGAEEKINKAIEHLTKAAEEKVPHAMHYLGNIFDQKGDVHTAFQWFQKAASQNLAQSQYELGRRYLEGLGADKNDIEAFKWIEAAAEQQLVEAECHLAYMYLHGLGTSKNESAALRWYKCAAEKNDIPSKYRLSLLYLEGTEVKDALEGAKWLKIAADENYPFAQYNLGARHFSSLNSQEVIEQDYKKAAQYFENFLQTVKGNSTFLEAAQHVQFALGLTYYAGLGNVAKNYEKAHKHFMAVETHPAAQYFLGLMYLNGEGVTKDRNQAIVWFRKATEQGNVEAHTLLIKLALEEKDQTAARKLLFPPAKHIEDKGPEAVVHSLGLSEHTSVSPVATSVSVATESSDLKSTVHSPEEADYALLGFSKETQTESKSTISSRKEYPKAAKHAEKNKMKSILDAEISKCTMQLTVLREKLIYDSSSTETLNTLINDISAIDHNQPGKKAQNQFNALRNKIDALQVKLEEAERKAVAKTKRETITSEVKVSAKKTSQPSVFIPTQPTNAGVVVKRTRRELYASELKGGLIQALATLKKIESRWADIASPEARVHICYAVIRAVAVVLDLVKRFNATELKDMFNADTCESARKVRNNLYHDTTVLKGITVDYIAEHVTHVAEIHSLGSHIINCIDHRLSSTSTTKEAAGDSLNFDKLRELQKFFVDSPNKVYLKDVLSETESVILSLHDVEIDILDPVVIAAYQGAITRYGCAAKEVRMQTKEQRRHNQQDTDEAYAEIEKRRLELRKFGVVLRHFENGQIPEIDALTRALLAKHQQAQVSLTYQFDFTPATFPRLDPTQILASNKQQESKDIRSKPAHAVDVRGTPVSSSAIGTSTTRRDHRSAQALTRMQGGTSPVFSESNRTTTAAPDTASSSPAKTGISARQTSAKKR